MISLDAQDFPATQRFVIERRLGAGGMGVVYQAFDKERNISVALKTLARFDADALFYLKNEFRALADVRHPNLVVLYDFFSADERWFFTMEMIHGVDLLTYIRDPVASTSAMDTSGDSPIDSPIGSRARMLESPVPRSTRKPSETGATIDAEDRGEIEPPFYHERRLRSAFRQMALGIKALHDRGKVHRDLKPTNVLVTPDDRVVILDFGLASDFTKTRLNPTSASGRTGFAGTIHYMSPEQVGERALTDASDWYQVGVMMYEAMTGAFPFDGTAAAVVRAKSTSDPPPPPPQFAHLPQDLVQLTMELLRRDPLERPHGEEIVRRLSAGIEPAQTWKTAERVSTAFVGRREHLAALEESFESVKKGRCTAVFVSGSSGMGKTALVQEFLMRVTAMKNAVILPGRCYAREFVPFKALDEMIDGITIYLKRKPQREAREVLPKDLAALVRVFPTLSRVSVIQRTAQPSNIADPQELRRRAFDALKQLLRRIARRERLVIFIDDLQWGDLDSASLISHLLSAPGTPAMMFVGCFATEDAERSALLSALREERARRGRDGADIRDLEVGPLGEGEARDLALAMIGSYDPNSRAMIKDVAREAAGSPFFVQELVRYTRIAGAEERVPEPRRDSVRLSGMLVDRIAQLPQEAQHLLKVIAVASRPIERKIALQSAGLDPNDEQLLALLVSNYFVHARVTKGTEGVETFHNRVRLAAQGLVGADELKQIHRAIAGAIEGAGQGDPELLAEHYKGAGELARAAKFAEAAGDRAMGALAFMRAAEFYSMALDVGAPDRELERSLLERLGDALARAGRGPKAAESYLAAVDGAPKNRALDLRHRAAYQLLLSGHVAEGTRVMKDVLRSVNVSFQSSFVGAVLALIRARIRVRWRGLHFVERDVSQVGEAEILRADACRSACMGFLYGDPIRAIDYNSRFLIHALDMGEPHRIARAILQESVYLAMVGGARTKRYEPALRIGRELGERLQDPYAQAFVALAEAAIALALGVWPDCYELSKKSHALFRDRCSGVAWEMTTARFLMYVSCFYLGRISEIIWSVPDDIEEARKRGDVFSQKVLSTHLLNSAWLAADKIDVAQRFVDQSIEFANQLGVPIDDTYLLAEGQIALYAGEGAKAFQFIRERWKVIRAGLRNQRVRIEMYHLRARSALAALQSGNTDGAQKDALRYARLIEGERMSWAEPFAKIVYAAVSARRGEIARSVQLLEEAETGFEAASMALYRAAARRARGKLIGGENGAALIAEADAFMAKESIVQPERMSALFLPGFPN